MPPKTLHTVVFVCGNSFTGYVDTRTEAAIHATSWAMTHGLDPRIKSIHPVKKIVALAASEYGMTLRLENMANEKYA